MWDAVVGGHCSKYKFQGGGTFSQGKHIVSCLDLQTCAKVIDDGTVGQSPQPHDYESDTLPDH